MKRKRVNAGFSMAEMILVVGLIAILSGVVFMNVVEHKKRMAFMEANETAKEIYLAGQEHLSRAFLQGTLDDVLAYSALNLSSASLAGADLGDPMKLSGESGDIYAIYIKAGKLTPAAQLAYETMFPTGAIDAYVQGYNVAIRYDRSSYRVLDVFYTKDTYDFSSWKEADWTKYLGEIKGKTTRAALDEYLKNFADGVIMGYYGEADVTGVSGGDSSNPNDPRHPRNPSDATVTLNLVNGPVLYALVTLDGDYDFSKAWLEITGEGATGEPFKIYFGPDGDGKADEEGYKWNEDKNKTNSYIIILDDVTIPVPGYDFEDRTRTSGIKLGAEISVTAHATVGEGDDEQSYDSGEAQTRNSLFADGSSPTNVKIENFRHLQNLGKLPAGSFVTASLSQSVGWNTFVADIVRHWSDYFENRTITGVSSGGSSVSISNANIRDSVKYFPINPNYTLEFNGGGNSVMGLTIKDILDENIGLFGTLTNTTTIHDLNMTDNTAVRGFTSEKDPTKFTKNAGALIGKVDGATVTIENVLFADTTIEKGTSDSLENAGVLIGKISGGNVTVNGVTLKGTTNVSGGTNANSAVIGAVDIGAGTLKVKSVRNAVSADADEYGEISVQGGSAGGVIGAVASGTVNVGEETGSDIGAEWKGAEIGNSTTTNAGALLGAVTGGTVNVYKSASYGKSFAKSSTEPGDARPPVTASGAAGGLIGLISGSGTKVTLKECAAAHIVDGGTSANAGGLVGAVEGGDLTITLSYASSSKTDDSRKYKRNRDGSLDADVTGANAAGLVGLVSAGSVQLERCYSTASAKGTTANNLINKSGTGAFTPVDLKTDPNIYGTGEYQSGSDGIKSGNQKTPSPRMNADTHPYNKELLKERYKEFPYQRVHDMMTQAERSALDASIWWAQEHMGDWPPMENLVTLNWGIGYDETLTTIANDNVRYAWAKLNEAPKDGDVITLSVSTPKKEELTDPSVEEASSVLYAYRFDGSAWSLIGRKLAQNAWETISDSNAQPKMIMDALQPGYPDMDSEAQWVRVPLDDITADSGQDRRFRTLYPGLAPGEPVCVRSGIDSDKLEFSSLWSGAPPVYPDEVSVANEKYPNTSLVIFDFMWSHSQYSVATITNVRHLQNLDASVSGVGEQIKTATLSKDLDWQEKDSGGASVWQGKTFYVTAANGSRTEAKTFYGISNPNLQSFTGGNKTLSNFVIDRTAADDTAPDKDAALFRAFNLNGSEQDVTSRSVSNLTLDNLTVISREDGNAAGLIANTSYAQVSNVNLTKTTSNPQITSNGKGHAAGLVANATGFVAVQGTSLLESPVITAEGTGHAAGVVASATGVNAQNVTLNTPTVTAKGANANAGGLAARLTGEASNQTIQNITLTTPTVTAKGAKGHAAGLLADVTGPSDSYRLSIANVTLDTPEVTAEGASGRAGGLIGDASGNVQITSTATAAVTLTAPTVTASGTNGYAGGLIADTSGNVEVTGASANAVTLTAPTVTASGEGGRAGGLIASTSQTTTVELACVEEPTVSAGSAGNEGSAGTNGIAGGFIASASGTTKVKTVLVKSGDKTVKASGSGAAGGLVGETKSGALTITNSAATIYVKAGGDAGGLIGTVAAGSANVTASYAGGHTSGGKYLKVSDDATKGRWNVQSTSGAAGGIVGSVASGATFNAAQSFSAASVSAATSESATNPAGGIIGQSLTDKDNVNLGKATDADRKEITGPVYSAAPVNVITKQSEVTAEGTSTPSISDATNAGAFIGTGVAGITNRLTTFYLPQLYGGSGTKFVQWKDVSGNTAKGSYYAYAGNGATLSNLDYVEAVSYADSESDISGVKGGTYTDLELDTKLYDTEGNPNASAEYPFKIWTTFQFEPGKAAGHYYYGDFEAIQNSASKAYKVKFTYTAGDETKPVFSDPDDSSSQVVRDAPYTEESGLNIIPAPLEYQNGYKFQKWTLVGTGGTPIYLYADTDDADTAKWTKTDSNPGISQYARITVTPAQMKQAKTETETVDGKTYQVITLNAVYVADATTRIVRYMYADNGEGRKYAGEEGLTGEYPTDESKFVKLLETRVDSTTLKKNLFQPKPNLPEYEFLGWYTATTDADDNPWPDSAKFDFTSSDPIGADNAPLTLYARFRQVKYYVVTFRFQYLEGDAWETYTTQTYRQKAYEPFTETVKLLNTKATLEHIYKDTNGNEIADTDHDLKAADTETTKEFTPNIPAGNVNVTYFVRYGDEPAPEEWYKIQCVMERTEKINNPRDNLPYQNSLEMRTGATDTLTKYFKYSATAEYPFFLEDAASTESDRKLIERNSDVFKDGAPTFAGFKLKATQATPATGDDAGKKTNPHLITYTYERRQYDLTFNANGGSNISAKWTYYYGQPILTGADQLKAATPSDDLRKVRVSSAPVTTRQGWYCSGWECKEVYINDAGTISTSKWGTVYYSGDSGKIKPPDPSAGVTAIEADWTMPPQDTTVRAKWDSLMVQYTVLYWLQKVTDKHDAEDNEKAYDFKEMGKFWGLRGSIVENLPDTDKSGKSFTVYNGQEYRTVDYTHAKYNAANSDPAGVEIAANGSTVLNLRYDRVKRTINFNIYTYASYVQATDDNGTQYGLLDDGTYVELTRIPNFYFQYVYTPVTSTQSGSYYYKKDDDVYSNSATYLSHDSRGFYYTDYWDNKYYVDAYTRSVGATNNIYNGVIYSYDHQVATSIQNSVTYYGVDSNGCYVALSRINKSYRWAYNSGAETYEGTRYKGSGDKSWRPYMTFTGLYEQTFTDAGYEWPTKYWWYKSGYDNGTVGAPRTTFLYAFTDESMFVNASNHSDTLQLYGKKDSGNNDIRHFLQDLNSKSSWSEKLDNRTANNATAPSYYSTPDFTLSSKYLPGFSLYGYDNSGSAPVDNNSIITNDVTEGTPAYSYRLNVYHKRKTFDLQFVDVTGGDAQIYKTVSVPYEADLKDWKPSQWGSNGLLKLWDEHDDVSQNDWSPEDIRSSQLTNRGLNPELYDEWDGEWYADQTCDPNSKYEDWDKVNSEERKMPAHPVMVYFKYAKPKVTVEFDLTKNNPSDGVASWGLEDDGSLVARDNSFTVEAGENIDEFITNSGGALYNYYKEITFSGAYRFDGWYYDGISDPDDSTKNKKFASSDPMTKDLIPEGKSVITLYPGWVSTEKEKATVKLLYYYVDANNKKVAVPSFKYKDGASEIDSSLFTDDEGNTFRCVELLKAVDEIYTASTNEIVDGGRRYNYKTGTRSINVEKNGENGAFNDKNLIQLEYEYEPPWSYRVQYYVRLDNAVPLSDLTTDDRAWIKDEFAATYQDILIADSRVTTDGTTKDLKTSRQSETVAFDVSIPYDETDPSTGTFSPPSGYDNYKLLGYQYVLVDDTTGTVSNSDGTTFDNDQTTPGYSVMIHPPAEGKSVVVRFYLVADTTLISLKTPDQKVYDGENYSSWVDIDVLKGFEKNDIDYRVHYQCWNMSTKERVTQAQNADVYAETAYVTATYKAGETERTYLIWKSLDCEQSGLSLVIMPRAVTLTSVNATDNSGSAPLTTPLTAPTVYVSEGTFASVDASALSYGTVNINANGEIGSGDTKVKVKDDCVIFAVDAFRRNPGVTKNVFDANFSDNFARNYSITKVYGTLTVK